MRSAAVKLTSLLAGGLIASVGTRSVIPGGRTSLDDVWIVVGVAVAGFGFLAGEWLRRRSVRSQQIRGFEVKTNTDEMSVLLKKEENDHG